MFPTKDLAHTVLGDILVSTKVLDPYSALPVDFPLRLRMSDEELARVGLKNIETMILTEKTYRFSDYQIKYQVHDEIRAVRRHQWIVWVICEMIGHPHPPRPSRFAFISEDA